MSVKRLSDRFKTAFITGASSGIGLALAGMLLDEGLQVWGTSRDTARLAPLSLRPGFHPIALDLSRPAAVEASYALALGEAGGSFDLVIQNAGFGCFAPFESADGAFWQSQLEAMVIGVTRLSRAAYAGMLLRGTGTLVHVTSLAVEFPLPFMSGYNMSKAALSALSESLLMESRGTDLCILEFRPADYRTPFNDAMRPPAPLLAAHARAARAWQRLEQNLREAPDVSLAAADLRRALARGRSGVIRSGGFFQARLAPLLASLAPHRLVRACSALYFKIH